MVELNERQQRFVDEYVKSGIAYSAALAAGYSETYAKTDSHKLLENKRIKLALEERMSVLKKSAIADQDEIMQFLTAVIRGEVSEPVAIMDGAGRQRIEQLAPNVQTRRSAAVDLGKRYAMWTDKQQIDADIGINVVVDYGDTPES